MHSPGQTPRKDSPSALTFSNASPTTLKNLGISWGGFLSLKDPEDNDKRLADSRRLGEDQLWSSANLHRHITVLKSLIPKSTEAGARIWIDLFFFRASAMLLPGLQMLLSPELNIPDAIVFGAGRFKFKLSEFINYSVVVVGGRSAHFYHDFPTIETAKKLDAASFFVAEAKSGPINGHLPQAVCEMFACAKLLGKDVIRGALTNGHEWIFIILQLPVALAEDNSHDASYKITQTIRLEDKYRPPTDMPDIIAGILSDWISNAFMQLTDNDWVEDRG
ncbi:hypothetical protein BC827DRAFT_948769 [Russula dissimulans]|nr:hypothetical protein BC827DRAFT_948769 [Russula dissimulans]